MLVRVRVIDLRLAQRADRAWAARRPPLRRVTLHECRHTYASYLMAAGYTLREIMEYVGHASLAATERYVKLLPQPDDRLNDYGQRAAGAPARDHRIRSPCRPPPLWLTTPLTTNVIPAAVGCGSWRSPTAQAFARIRLHAVHWMP